MPARYLAAILWIHVATSWAQAAPHAALAAEQVAPGVHVLYGEGGNIGVSAGADGVFLVDDQYAALTPKVLEALATIHPDEPRFVLNTHWHMDHTGGNENLARQGSIILAHDRVRARMAAEHYSKFFDRKTPASPGGALPVVTFNDGVTFHLNGEEMRAYHVPQAHTDGDAFIHFRKANVMHTGDLMFAGMYPFIDLDSGGSVAGVIAAVDRMLQIADGNTRIIPGHGKITDRKGLEAYRAMLATTSGRMREFVKAGKTVEQVLAEKPFATLDETLAWQFITAERYVRILYRDAAASGPIK